MRIGDKVKVLGKGNGIIRYIGFPLFKPDVWFGIELEDCNGNNNGTIDNITYFKCQDKYGFFVQVSSLQEITKDDDSRNDMTILKENKEENKEENKKKTKY